MADIKVSQLPSYPSGQSPIGTDLLLVIDTSNPGTFVSRKLPYSNLGQGLQLQVDGVAVTPVNNVISFDDSQEPFNQCFFEAVGNSIRVGIDGDTGIAVPSISLVAGNTPRVTFTASSGTTAYSLVMPLAQGATNTFLRNDGAGTLSWVAETGTGTVTSVALTVPVEFTVSGSPITTNGTLAITKANQAANLLYAGPATGIDAQPTFRALAKADVVTVTNTGIRSDENPYVQGDVTFLAGTNVMLTQTGNNITINATGGGGGSFISSAIWTGGTASKDAYTSPGVVNSQGITISLTASSGSGQITGATVRLNGVALSNTYVSTGTFPNYTIVIPVADISSNAAQTANTVTISITGTFGGSGLNISDAGMLINVQPVAFTSSLTASYSPNVLPFYTTTSTINYSYSNSVNATSFNGIITPVGSTAQNATSASGSFTNQAINGAAISGSVTGNGSNGAGSATVSLSGSTPAVTVYTPAFYLQTANSTVPTFTTASTQTSGAAAGSTVVYPVASSFNQYDWVATQRPLGNIMIVTPFGNAAFVPDVTAIQTISGQSFNVYGITRLSTTAAVQLVIS